MTAKSTTAEKLKKARAELHDLQVIFDYQGGRGIELADSIDWLSKRIERLEAKLLRETQGAA